MTATIMTGGIRAARASATVARLLDAATSILCAEGAAAVSVQRVAAAAGTSKALVHYHFAGKDALLIACVEHVARDLATTEAAALTASDANAALDDLWHAVMHPRARATRRALLALTTDATPATRAALQAAAAERRRAATTLMIDLERLMQLAPSVPRLSIATAFLALVDGLTLDPAPDADMHQRRAFDAFWLAVLSLDR